MAGVSPRSLWLTVSCASQDQPVVPAPPKALPVVLYRTPADANAVRRGPRPRASWRAEQATVYVSLPPDSIPTAGLRATTHRNRRTGGRRDDR